MLSQPEQNGPGLDKLFRHSLSEFEVARVLELHGCRRWPLRSCALSSLASATVALISHGLTAVNTRRLLIEGYSYLAARSASAKHSANAASEQQFTPDMSKHIGIGRSQHFVRLIARPS